MTELPYVLSLFLTFSRKKSQLDAVPAHFFSIFSKLSGIWRGTNALRRCPTLQGAGYDIAAFGVICGRFFFDHKSNFFNFDIDKTWFGGGLDPLAVEKIYFANFFFSLGRCNGAGPKIT